MYTPPLSQNSFFPVQPRSTELKNTGKDIMNFRYLSLLKFVAGIIPVTREYQRILMILIL